MSSDLKADEGWLARTAARFRSWVKLSIWRPSASSSLPMSSATGSSRAEADTSRTAASWATVNRRPIDAATAATVRAAGLCQGGPPAVEADEAVLAQAGEQFQEKERASPHALGQCEQAL